MFYIGVIILLIKSETRVWDENTRTMNRGLEFNWVHVATNSNFSLAETNNNANWDPSLLCNPGRSCVWLCNYEENSTYVNLACSFSRSCSF